MIKEPVRDLKYDFSGESYGDSFPNLHRYPATMIPQIGVKLLKDFSINSGILLDPYCGSGSSFSAALEVGDFNLNGFDLNPLAILICKAKFTLLEMKIIRMFYDDLKAKLLEEKEESCDIPPITNIDYWYSKEVQKKLAFLRYTIYNLIPNPYQSLFLVPFCETARDCSYTRPGEFKLFRIPEEKIAGFQPEPLSYYLKKLQKSIEIYEYIYFPRLHNRNVQLRLNVCDFSEKSIPVDVILTSPPYGDSRTTVAYGQFSNFANEWLEFPQARKLDVLLLGGKKNSQLYEEGVIGNLIQEIANMDFKRALEVSAFYNDLAWSIKSLANAVNKRGWVFFVLGNRTIKNVQLRTDLFVAEQFSQYNFNHVVTFERKISNKVMPLANSPTNINGKTAPTMTMEYIVCLQKNY